MLRKGVEDLEGIVKGMTRLAGMVSIIGPAAPIPNTTNRGAAAISGNSRRSGPGLAGEKRPGVVSDS